VGRIDDLGKDRYGRTLGIVRLDKRHVNLDLVREGWAWWYRKQAPKNKELAKAVTIYGASQTLTRNLRTSALAAATYSR
jgi:endonuclease YncB( thermonuclease family)